jgi:hypothetical protein
LPMAGLGCWPGWWMLAMGFAERALAGLHLPGPVVRDRAEFAQVVLAVPGAPDPALGLRRLRLRSGITRVQVRVPGRVGVWQATWVRNGRMRTRETRSSGGRTLACVLRPLANFNRNMIHSLPKRAKFHSGSVGTFLGGNRDRCVRRDLPFGLWLTGTGRERADGVDLRISSVCG